ncbi:faciogenital dysplasia protein [Anaeramoeba flamelloides]|uniref:Faciogenital dysplasia protein n=1 Tax=Anaeramoeba flamelloides TaxID=1746091 RepID=A0ABQ8YSM6_9EUKA|nr:faciogenital dysplasia protein [Anaeramoeba flamelloides]
MSQKNGKEEMKKQPPFLTRKFISVEIDCVSFPTGINTERDRVVEELYHTEHNYLSNLEILLNKIQKEFFKIINQEIEVKGSNIETMFKNLTSIFNINSQLYTHLEERIRIWDQNDRIGDIPYLKMYSDYYRNYRNSDENLRKILRNSKKIKDWAFQKRKTYGNDLSSMLIMPIQRVPRYELLLKKLIEVTPKNHLDYKELQEALEKITKVNLHINNSIAHSENQEKVLSIQKTLSSSKLSVIVQPHRVYVSQVKVQKISTKKTIPRLIFLFSDVLITAEFISNNYQIDDYLELKHTYIENLKDTEVLKNAFKIISKKTSFTICLPTLTLKNQWYEKINGTINNYMKNLKTLSLSNKRDLKKAPVWVPDSVATNCGLCNKAFSMLKRRHHCRSCGKCICGNCSKYKIVLEHLHKFKKVRVCNRCYKEILDDEEFTQVMKNTCSNNVTSSMSMENNYPIILKKFENGEMSIINKKNDKKKKQKRKERKGEKKKNQRKKEKLQKSGQSNQNKKPQENNNNKQNSSSKEIKKNDEKNKNSNEKKNGNQINNSNSNSNSNNNNKRKTSQKRVTNLVEQNLKNWGVTHSFSSSESSSEEGVKEGGGEGGEIEESKIELRKNIGTNRRMKRLEIKSQYLVRIGPEESLNEKQEKSMNSFLEKLQNVYVSIPLEKDVNSKKVNSKSRLKENNLVKN